MKMKKKLIIGCTLAATVLISGIAGMQYVEKQKIEFEMQQAELAKEAEIARLVEIEHVKWVIYKRFIQNCTIPPRKKVETLVEMHLYCTRRFTIPYHEDHRYELRNFDATRKATDRELAGLLGVTKAHFMDLSRTNITHVDFLANLTEVNTLSLSDTSIANFDGLSNLKNVTIFWAKNTKLKNVDGMLNLKGYLAMLDLTENPLLDDVGGLKNITGVADSLRLDDRNFSVKMPENSVFCQSDVEVIGPKSKSQYCEGSW